uniref:Uncharacterized protein n=1 Tax=Timema poppense TaxID=170557 RepID=A0A7R9H2L5_TIMPO|nr:unnamed protein product [Timema poppensis]
MDLCRTIKLGKVRYEEFWVFNGFFQGFKLYHFGHFDLSNNPTTHIFREVRKSDIITIFQAMSTVIQTGDHTLSIFRHIGNEGRHWVLTIYVYDDHTYLTSETEDKAEEQPGDLQYPCFQNLWYDRSVYQLLKIHHNLKMWKKKVMVCNTLVKRVSASRDESGKGVGVEIFSSKVSRGNPHLKMRPIASAVPDNREVALRVSHSSLKNSNRMKPKSGDQVVMINFLEEANLTSLSIGSNVKHLHNEFSLGSLEVLEECGMFRHLLDVLPFLLEREAHHIEYPVQLVVMVRIAGFDVLLTTVEDWFRGQQLSKYTAYSPDI